MKTLVKEPTFVEPLGNQHVSNLADISQTDLYKNVLSFIELRIYCFEKIMRCEIVVKCCSFKHIRITNP